tara:strand:+ start:222 stop:1550 length:1329 start_codon:yes stop_codon:yes gene_type:complete
MELCYRVTFETYNKSHPNKIITKKEILSDAISKPSNCLDFSMGLTNQINLIQNTQNNLLIEKVNLSNTDNEYCPHCIKKLHKYGTRTSWFYDALTDHQVKMPRFKCSKCKYEVPSTVKSLIGDRLSGDLKNIQSTLGANHSYREGEKIFELFCSKEREINNHDRIKSVVEAVGCSIAKINAEEKTIIAVPAAAELVLNVDGGHVKTTEDQRSFEAMVSVIYRPESLKSNNKDTRNRLVSKHCAASIKNDNQAHIISSTVIAALKQGMNENTHITTLCDGAQNCWNVAKALEPFCGSVTYILDWFHLAMKFENIALPSKLKEELMRVKWFLWRGEVDNALIRFNELLEQTSAEKHYSKIKKLIQYVENNRDKIVNYSKRDDEGLVFTSNLAESTVESLINQRCKGQQHMRWSRDGLNPVLQLRAAIYSDDWSNKWRGAVLNAA